jgi:hypothetical protein
MKAELFITKDRIPYIVEALGTDKVTVTEHSGDQDLVSFVADSPLDLLHMFHAGIQFGSDSMANALIRR